MLHKVEFVGENIKLKEISFNFQEIIQFYRKMQISELLVFIYQIINLINILWGHISSQPILILAKTLLTKLPNKKNVFNADHTNNTYFKVHI